MLGLSMAVSQTTAFRSKTDKVLRPVLANAGIEAQYRRKLEAMIDEMARSVFWWVKAAYRRDPPEIMAQDELSSAAMRDAIKKLVKRWQDRFDVASQELAKYFALSIQQRSDAALRKILKDGGFAIEFKMTRAQRDVLNASIAENVSLIKSIPAQFLTQVEGSVYRAVTAGRDLKMLTDDLRKHYGVTRRRAKFIALDQSNKVTASLNRARMIEIGIDQAVWRHSHAGKIPRPSHVAMDGKKYDVAKGMYDSAVKKFVLPGELPRCRCFSRAIMPGFN